MNKRYINDNKLNLYTHITILKVAFLIIFVIIWSMSLHTFVAKEGVRPMYVTTHTKIITKIPRAPKAHGKVRQGTQVFPTL